MSSTRENREAERADLVSMTAKKSDEMRTSPAIEQTYKEQTHQATPVGAITGNALLRSSVITPPRGPEHTVDRGNKPLIWDDDYFERHSSIYQNHKSPCPSPRRKSAQAKNEGAELAAPENNTLSRTPPSVETSATAEDPVCRLSSPVLSSSLKVHQEQQKPSSAEGILVRPDDGRIKARTESAPEKNKLSRTPLPAETTATAEDTVWRSSPPILSSSSEAHEYLEKSVEEKLEARTKTAPEKNTLSRAPLPAETIATAEDPFWKSSPLMLSNTSEAHGGQQNSSPATGNIEKPDDETIEARTETAPDVNQPLSKRPIPLDWSSSEPDRSSSSGVHQYQLSSGTVRELLEASYRKGEAWKGVPLGENPFLSKLPFPPAKSRGTDDEGVKAPQRTAPGEQNPYSSPTLPSSSVVSHQDFSPTPVCLPEPKTFGQTRKRILSSPRPPIPAQKILSSSRFLGVRFAEEPAEEDSRSFRYFSHVEVPLECHAAKVQNQTAKLPPRKRKHAATEDDNGDDLAAQSQHRELPNPSPDSKIQKLPTKDPSNQYYSHQAFGGWRVLNAEDAAIEIEKEKKAKKARTVAKKRRSEVSSPAGTDHPCRLSCRPSDKLWKSWENKHLLRSHAAGSSFAQIGALEQFNEGLVIRTEDECREQYETLQQWQPFQDEELLRAGDSAGDDSFAAVCARNFSKGLVKRSAQQCKERYEFLKKNEDEVK